MMREEWDRRQARKQAEVQERAEGRAKLTPAAQLKELDARLGVGKGATKERDRLIDQIEQQRVKAEVAAQEEVKKAAKPKKPPKVKKS